MFGTLLGRTITERITKRMSNLPGPFEELVQVKEDSNLQVITINYIENSW